MACVGVQCGAPCVCVFIPQAYAFRCIAQPKTSALIFLRPTLHSNSHEWHRSKRDRLTDLPHVAGTGLRTHVDARRESGVSGFCVSSSCSVVLFSPCFSAFVRACGPVVVPSLLFPCSLFHRSWCTCTLGMYFFWLVAASTNDLN